MVRTCDDNDDPCEAARTHASPVASHSTQRGHVKSSTKKGTDCLDWKRPASTTAAFPLTPSPRGDAERPSGEPGMHHDPNPFDEGTAGDENPFSVSQPPLPSPLYTLIYRPLVLRKNPCRLRRVSGSADLNSRVLFLSRCRMEEAAAGSSSTASGPPSPSASAAAAAGATPPSTCPSATWA